MGAINGAIVVTSMTNDMRETLPLDIPHQRIDDDACRRGRQTVKETHHDQLIDSSRQRTGDRRSGKYQRPAQRVDRRPRLISAIGL